MPYPDSEYPSILRGKDKRESQRLLAAAHDLFSLLRECSSSLADILSAVDPSGLECQEQWACIAECKAAIAKAEGRE
jgi:hypothetical protein